MRKFEKISPENYQKSLDQCGISGNFLSYAEYELPTRGTPAAAGYDFQLLANLKLEPGESRLLPTGIKACYADNEVLFIILRSSSGIKHSLRLENQVGVIDADYYNNEENEGHIFYKIRNESKRTKFFPKGSTIVQGIFLNYLITDDDKFLDSSRTIPKPRRKAKY